jgi:hypothetical protein
VRRRQSLLSTVTPTVFAISQLPAAGEFAIGFGERTVRIGARGRSHARLLIEERVRLETSSGSAAGEAWNARLAAYRYQLHTDEETEVFSFHWHPGVPGIPTPHLHISSGAGSLIPELQRAHIPTGEVSLEAFLAFLIRDFNVRPHRADYARVLGPEI